MEHHIDIRKINLDELIGVVSLYPWFGAARVELCRRMNSLGEVVTDAQYSDTAMYIVSRDKLSQLRRKSSEADLSDSDIQSLLKKYIADGASDSEHIPAGSERQVFVVGGDYFSQTDYEKVRKTEDNVFARYAAKAKQEYAEASHQDADEYPFCTETLAQIYADQGYYEQAKDIYSKLILAYPEKNTYFAALIEKLEEIKN